MSGGVEWAMHCCVVLSAAEAPVSGSRLAELHEVSPSYLAKHLQALSRAGIIRSTQGQTGGYVLTRGAAEITVLEVVQAIDGEEPAFRCTNLRRRGPLAVPEELCVRPCGIHQAMMDAEAAWRAALASVTLADIATGIDTDYGMPVMPLVADWLRAPNGEDRR